MQNNNKILECKQDKQDKKISRDKFEILLITVYMVMLCIIYSASLPAPAIASHIHNGHKLEVFEGRTGYYVWVEATAYWVDDPVDASGTGLAADGERAIPYHTLAVDPDTIPWHTDIFVPGIGWMYSHDTGGAIAGYIIDIGMPSREAAFEWGRRDVRIFVATDTRPMNER